MASVFTKIVPQLDIKAMKKVGQQLNTNLNNTANKAKSLGSKIGKAAHIAAVAFGFIQDAFAGITKGIDTTIDKVIQANKEMADLGDTAQAIGLTGSKTAAIKGALELGGFEGSGTNGLLTTFQRILSQHVSTGKGELSELGGATFTEALTSTIEWIRNIPDLNKRREMIAKLFGGAASKENSALFFDNNFKFKNETIDIYRKGISKNFNKNIAKAQKADDVITKEGIINNLQQNEVAAEESEQGFKAIKDKNAYELATLKKSLEKMEAQLSALQAIRGIENVVNNVSTFLLSEGNKFINWITRVGPDEIINEAKTWIKEYISDTLGSILVSIKKTIFPH